MKKKHFYLFIFTFVKPNQSNVCIHPWRSAAATLLHYTMWRPSWIHIKPSSHEGILLIRLVCYTDIQHTGKWLINESSLFCLCCIYRLKLWCSIWRNLWPKWLRHSGDVTVSVCLERKMIHVHAVNESVCVWRQCISNHGIKTNTLYIFLSVLEVQLICLQKSWAAEIIPWSVHHLQFNVCQ